MSRLTFFSCALVFLWFNPSCTTQVTAAPRPAPRLQALPLPHHEISFQRDGRELTRYHYSPDLHRPFLYPVNGSAGRSLTRMGHPHDPESHSHHNSIWISHHDVGGFDFWGDRAKNLGTIRHQRLDRFGDGDEEAFVEVVNHWQADGRVLVVERRRVAVRNLPGEAWLLLIDLELSPARDPVVFGQTPFGFLGVRLAKSIGVHDGGGTIRNSVGGVDEKGVFWKPARWVDYSGAIAGDQRAGLTVFDHPDNRPHPAVFHVRDDGWMGPSATFAEPHTLATGQVWRYRYGVYVHDGIPETQEIDRQWAAFSELPTAEFAPLK